MRQLLVESAVLAAVGAACGVLLAWWWTDALVSTILPEDLPPWLDVSLDASAVGVTVAAAVVSVLLFGLLPALRASRPDVLSALKGSGRTLAGDAGRLRHGLVVAQVAMTVVLLAAAATFMQSFLGHRRGDFGFDDAPVVSARVQFESAGRQPASQRIVWMRSALERVRALPGVAAAALTGSIPGDDGGDRVPLTVEGRAVAPGDEPMVIVVPTSDGFFETLGVPLLAGRGFTPAEAADTAAAVAVVGQALAERVWPGEDPIGRRIRASLPADSAWLTVIGVARNIQYEELGEDEQADRLQVHVPYGRELWRGAAMLVRTAGRPAAMAEPMRGTLRDLASNVAVYHLRTMGQVRSETAAGDRIWVFVFGTFGAQALLVAAVGLYGLLAYSVALRRREIGVRIAMGARPAAVVRMVVAQAAGMAALGIAVGLVGAAFLTRVLRGMLWGVTGSLQPLILVSGVLLVTALAAALAPARRAAGVDPMEALRAD